MAEHNLRRRGDTVAGRVRALVGPAEYRYAIHAGVQGRSLSGEYEGAYGIKAWQESLRGDVSGDLQARAEPSSALRFELDFSSLYTRGGHIRHPSVRCTLREGKATDGQFYSRTGGKRGFTGQFDCEHLTQPVATDEHLLVFEPNPTYGGEKGRRGSRDGVLGAYRFDESGAERDWVLPGKYIHELHLDGGPSRRVIPRDGLVYYLNWTCHPQRGQRLLIIREKDSRILADWKGEHDQFYRWGKGLVLVADNQHESLWPAIYQAADPDPAKFGLLGKPWRPRVPVPGRIGTCGYEVPIYDAFADGFMFCRTGNGEILCYDLRRRAAK